MTPETYLRLMAHDLALAQPRSRLRVIQASVEAVARAFIMLGLLSAEGAVAALADARRAQALNGVGNLESAVWPRASTDFWPARAHGQHALTWTPRSVAVGAAELSVAGVDMRCSWFRVARAGLRFDVEVTAGDQQLLAQQAEAALGELSAADDAGRSYRLRWDSDRARGGVRLGEVVAEPVSERAQPGDIRWFELGTADGAAVRVVFAQPPVIGVGTADSAWPTAAECYLALLSRQDPAPELGRSGGRDVVAAVAESLVTVGAIPAQSPLLPQVLGRDKRSSHPDLPVGWPHAVRVGTPPDLEIALCAALPFEDAAVVIEGVSAWGEDIQLRVYGWPWIWGQQWPAAIPSFKVRATDDLGHEHEGHEGRWRDYGAGEGRGNFTLWPGVPRRVVWLRVVISTLWEARWAEVALPSRYRSAGGRAGGHRLSEGRFPRWVRTIAGPRRRCRPRPGRDCRRSAHRRCCRGRARWRSRTRCSCPR